MHSLYDINRRNARPVKSLAEHEADAHMLAGSAMPATASAAAIAAAERDEAIYFLREELEAKNGALASSQRRVDELRGDLLFAADMIDRMDTMLDEYNPSIASIPERDQVHKLQEQVRILRKFLA